MTRCPFHKYTASSCGLASFPRKRESRRRRHRDWMPAYAGMTTGLSEHPVCYPRPSAEPALSVVEGLRINSGGTRRAAKHIHGATTGESVNAHHCERHSSAHRHLRADPWYCRSTDCHCSHWQAWRPQERFDSDITMDSRIRGNDIFRVCVTSAIY